MIPGSDSRRKSSCLDELHPSRILSLLPTERLGRTVLFIDRVDSTNSFGAGTGLPPGSLVIAGEQYSGRGRKGRSWSSNALGSLVFSLVLGNRGEVESLTSLLALSAAAAIEEVIPKILVGIKWPNDIYILGKKAGGILAEARGDRIVLGLGLDVNESDSDFEGGLSETATSIRIASGERIDRGILLVAILARFEQYYSRWEREGFGVFSFDLESRLLWKGMSVSIESGDSVMEGILSGITKEGYLRILQDGEERIFQAGDVTLRKGKK